MAVTVLTTTQATEEMEATEAAFSILAVLC